jgi:hypothetical protein
MCTDIFENEELLMNIFYQPLQLLQFDKIVNVRITLAKVISKIFKNQSKNKVNNSEYPWAVKSEKVNRIASNLKKDLNKNVYNHFIEINNMIEYTDEGEYIEVNDSFVNKMEILREEFGITRNLPVNNCKIKYEKAKMVNKALEQEIPSQDKFSDLTIINSNTNLNENLNSNDSSVLNANSTLINPVIEDHVEEKEKEDGEKLENSNEDLQNKENINTDQ